MKKLVILLCTFLFCNHHIIAQTKNLTHRKLMGVFDGRTPCNTLAAYLNEPVGNDCIKIKWRLKLYVDSISNAPTEYELIGFRYRRGEPRKGNWQILKGTNGDPDAIVYQLNEKNGETLLLQKVDDNILFFLDKEKKPLIGNRDFSYTLNRKPEQ